MARPSHGSSESGDSDMPGLASSSSEGMVPPSQESETDTPGSDENEEQTSDDSDPDGPGPPRHRELPTVADFERIRREARRTRARLLWEGKKWPPLDIADLLDYLPAVPEVTLRNGRREVSEEVAWTLHWLETLIQAHDGRYDDSDGGSNMAPRLRDDGRTSTATSDIDVRSAAASAVVGGAAAARRRLTLDTPEGRMAAGYCPAHFRAGQQAGLHRCGDAMSCGCCVGPTCHVCIARTWQ